MGGLVLTEDRKKQILEKANEINLFSERYQLIHATYAIEKMFKEKLKSYYDEKFAALRAELLNENNVEKQDQIFKKVQELKSESNKKVRIIIEYIPQIENNSARVTTTKNNTIMISLPKSMESARNSDGKIDFEILDCLRKVMGHELGHIVLHSTALQLEGESQCELSEEEADYFSDELLKLRKAYTQELAKGI